MLKSISISDFHRHPSSSCRVRIGLKLLIGETGSSKSIIVGALGLLLGNRASAE